MNDVSWANLVLMALGAVGWALAVMLWSALGDSEKTRYAMLRDMIRLDASLTAAESAAEDFERRYINCAGELADMTNPPQWVPASKPVGLKP